MKRFWTLFKTQFVQQYRRRPNGKQKKVGKIVLYVALALCFLPILAFVALISYSLGEVVVSSGGDVTTALAFLMLGGQGVVMFFGIANVISSVFSCKDAENLLYLPVKPSAVFLSKMLVLYVDELLTSSLAVFFLILPFGIGANLGASFYLLLLPVLLLLPCLPMLLGTLVAMPVSALIARIGSNGTLKTVLRMLLFVAFMAVYLLFTYNLGYTTGSSEDMPIADLAGIVNGWLVNMQGSLKWIHPNFALACAMSAKKVFVNILFALAENAVLFVTVVLLCKVFYGKMLSLSLEGSGRSKKATNYQIRQKGVLKQLVVTDLKRTFRDNQLGFQAFAGVIVIPIVILILGINVTAEPEIDAWLYNLIAPIGVLLYLVILCAPTNTLGIFPISRENKSLYLLKTLPVSFGKILTAKVVLATAVNVVVSIVTIIVAIFSFHIKIYVGLLMLLCLVLYSYGLMCISTCADLKNPILGWTNFNQSLKNSSGVFKNMLVGFLVALGVGATAGLCILVYLLVGSDWVVGIMWFLLVAEGLLFAYLAQNNLLSKADKLFDNIEP